MKRRGDALFTLLLVVSDVAVVGLAFLLAYWLRRWVAFPPPVSIAPFRDYLPMMFVQVATMLVVFFFSRLYDVKRTQAPLDTLYRVFAAVSIGTISTIAFTTRVS